MWPTTAPYTNHISQSHTQATCAQYIKCGIIVEKMLEDGSLDGIHIFFPDPWHKKRHNKRRLVQVPFVEKLLPKLKSGGYVHMATDWEEYAVQMLEVLSSFDTLQNTAADYAPTPDYRPETKFEARGKRLGHGVWDLVFRKK